MTWEGDSFSSLFDYLFSILYNVYLMEHDKTQLNDFLIETRNKFVFYENKFQHKTVRK